MVQSGQRLENVKVRNISLVVRSRFLSSHSFPFNSFLVDSLLHSVQSVLFQAMNPVATSLQKLPGSQSHFSIASSCLSCIYKLYTIIPKFAGFGYLIYLEHPRASTTVGKKPRLGHDSAHRSMCKTGQRHSSRFMIAEVIEQKSLSWFN